jgi:hypothetical protein
MTSTQYKFVLRQIPPNGEPNWPPYLWWRTRRIVEFQSFPGYSRYVYQYRYERTAHHLPGEKSGAVCTSTITSGATGTDSTGTGTGTVGPTRTARQMSRINMNQPSTQRFCEHEFTTSTRTGSVLYTTNCLPRSHNIITSAIRFRFSVCCLLSAV